MSPLSSRLASLLVLLSLPSLALSCTTVAVPTETDGLVIGRTMELGGLDLLPHWKMVVHPRSSAGTPGGSNPLGFVSVDVLTNDRIPPAVALGTCAEGMNENGLSVSAQTQQGAEYQDFLFDDAAGALKPRLPYLDVAAYILGTCSSAADVEEALRSVVVYGKSAPKGARFHWVIFDADDQSLIVEYIAGELVVRDNTAVGVFTNDPV
jgi:penicillin V acylase-like amidase (Ntn superfamily)